MPEDLRESRARTRRSKLSRRNVFPKPSACRKAERPKGYLAIRYARAGLCLASPSMAISTSPWPRSLFSRYETVLRGIPVSRTMSTVRAVPSLAMHSATGSPSGV